MDRPMFETYLEELDGNSLNTLKEKNARYAPGNDALHNFNKGAEVFGGTAAQACWGYMTKHLVALRDMVHRNDFSNREDFLEKCQDTINYIRFLWCIGNEENQKLVSCGCKVNEIKATDYHEFLFDTQGEATVFVNEMRDIRDRVGVVTLGDAYHFLEWMVPDRSYYKVGWRNLDEIHFRIPDCRQSNIWVVRIYNYENLEKEND